MDQNKLQHIIEDIQKISNVKNITLTLKDNSKLLCSEEELDFYMANYYFKIKSNNQDWNLTYFDHQSILKIEVILKHPEIEELDFEDSYCS